MATSKITLHRSDRPIANGLVDYQTENGDLTSVSAYALRSRRWWKDSGVKMFETNALPVSITLEYDTQDE